MSLSTPQKSKGIQGVTLKSLKNGAKRGLEKLV
jgi:hypothetical protein